ncbi:MAG TPA: PaaI family thioesterase [Actinomycetota bacterium]|nr:PaaI family thioesterase [Actinomycetota bacterium]
MTRTRWEAVRAGDVTLPVNETLGFEIDRDADGVAYDWTVPPEYCHAEGNLQGGMLAAFADAVLGGVAANELPEDLYPVLAEMKISILRPAPAGARLRATGRIVKAGRRVLFTEAEITDTGTGKLVAKASGTALSAQA